MARIKIKDLPADKELSQDELKAVTGGLLLGSNCGISYNGAGAIANTGSLVSNPGSNCGISYNGGGAIANIGSIRTNDSLIKI